MFFSLPFGGGQSLAQRGEGEVAAKSTPFNRGLTRLVSCLHVSLYRHRPTSSRFSNQLILTTRGRRTGREIAKPLVYYERDGRVFVVASNRGNDNAPLWFLNLVSNPAVRVERGSSTPTNCRARVLTAKERAAMWPHLIARYPYYARHQATTPREIPIVELVPER